MKNLPLYKQYETTSAIAGLCLCNWGGIEILDVLYGIEDYVVACFNFGTGRQQVRRHKICTTSAGRLYFWKGHTRYYIDQFMRNSCRQKDLV